MIQRIQTVLLFLAVAVNSLVLFFPLWAVDLETGSGTATLKGMSIELSGEAVQAGGNSVGVGDNFMLLAHLILVALAGIFLLFVIFQFNDRQKQIRLAYIGMIILLAQMGLMVALSLTLGDQANIPEVAEGVVSFGFFFPVLALGLTWFAARQIKKDEELVRSMDRLR